MRKTNRLPATVTALEINGIYYDAHKLDPITASNMDATWSWWRPNRHNHAEMFDAIPKFDGADAFLAENDAALYLFVCPADGDHSDVCKYTAYRLDWIIKTTDGREYNVTPVGKGPAAFDKGAQFGHPDDATEWQEITLGRQPGTLVIYVEDARPAAGFIPEGTNMYDLEMENHLFFILERVEGN